MVNETIRDTMCKMGWNELVVFNAPAYDNSIVGVTEGGRVVYNYELMIKELMADQNIQDIESAMEFIDYNTVRSSIYMDEKYAPLIIYSIPKEGEEF